MAFTDINIQATHEIDWTKCKNFWALNFRRTPETNASIYFHFEPYEESLSADEMIEVLEKRLIELKHHLRGAQKYYKVLAADHTSLLARGKAKVTYTVGEFVSAPKWLARKGMHLMVYDTLKNAVYGYYREPSAVSIWEAEVRGIHEVIPSRIDFFKHLKDGRDAALIPHSKDYYPDGTVMVEQVKLLRQIHPEI